MIFFRPFCEEEEELRCVFHRSNEAENTETGSGRRLLQKENTPEYVTQATLEIQLRGMRQEEDANPGNNAVPSFLHLSLSPFGKVASSFLLLFLPLPPFGVESRLLIPCFSSLLPQLPGFHSLRKIIYLLSPALGSMLRSFFFLRCWADIICWDLNGFSSSLVAG